MKTRLLLLLVVIVLGGAVMIPLAAQDAPSAPTCDPAALNFEFGLSEHGLTFDGLNRRYVLYVPESYDAATPAPLVISIHGFASNPYQQMGYSAWNPIADEYGFIVAYPQGTTFPARWNSGELGFGDSTADDVGFISAMIDEISAALCIDATRVYANGLSNGGGMSHRLACELSDRITAIGGVAGYYTLAECEPTRPVPVIAFHGAVDQIVPIDGDAASGVQSISTWVSEWAARNNCETLEALPDVGAVTIERHTDCDADADVIYYRAADGGHTWPGGGEDQPRLISGPVNRDINASALMWEFFTQFTLPEQD